MENVATSGRINQLRNSKGRLVKSTSLGTLEPASPLAISQTHDFRTKTTQRGQLGSEVVALSELMGKIPRHDEHIDQGEQLKKSRLESVRSSIEGNEPSAFANDPRGVDAGGPVPPIEMKKTAGGQGLSR